jgi:O-antigen/teichoic acid export membrane protein
MTSTAVSNTEDTGPPKTSMKKNTIVRFFTGGIALVVTQASSIVIARALGASGKGLASVLFLSLQIAIMAVTFGLPQAGVYFVGRKKYSVQNVINTYLSAGLILGCLASLVFVALRHVVFGGKYPNLIIILSAALPAALLFNWLSSILRGQEKIAEVSCIEVVGNLLGLAALAFCLYVLRLKEVSLVWQTNVIMFYGLAATLVLIKRQGFRFGMKIDRKLLKDSVSFGMKSQVGQILQFINYRFDLFVVYYLLGISAAGVYSISTGVSTLIWQIPNALSYVLLSRVSCVSYEEGNLITHKVSRQSVMLSLVAAIFLVPVGYFGIPILYTNAFKDAIVALWLLLPGVVALSYYKTLAAHMLGQGHPEYGSYAAGVSAVLTLILDFLLIPKFGINGAAAASTIAYMLTAIIAIYWFARITKLERISELFIPAKSDFEGWWKTISSLCGRAKTSA